jgi:hypothetical protein
MIHKSVIWAAPDMTAWKLPMYNTSHSVATIYRQRKQIRWKLKKKMFYGLHPASF